jgi:ABC-type Na+ efflux pump permease subunit
VRRLARALLALGTVAAVLGLSQAHAAVHGYDLVGSSRFHWALVYAALMLTAGYAAGLPDLARSRRSVLTATSASALAAAVGVSVLQLLVGAPLLPRFVVLGAPLPLLPLSLLCAALARDGVAFDGHRSDDDCLDGSGHHSFCHGDRPRGGSRSAPPGRS